jgi:hypothetical protein
MASTFLHGICTRSADVGLVLVLDTAGRSSAREMVRVLAEALQPQQVRPRYE